MALLEKNGIDMGNTENKDINVLKTKVNFKAKLQNDTNKKRMC